MDYQPPRKKFSNIQVGCLAFVGLFVFMFIGRFIFSLIPEPTPPNPYEGFTQLQIDSAKVAQHIADSINYRNKLIENQFSKWDGSHINLAKYIKSEMNDPRSYEHVATQYWEFEDYLIVQTEFSGTNAFGATVRQYVKVKTDLLGEITEVLEIQ